MLVLLGCDFNIPDSAKILPTSDSCPQKILLKPSKQQIFVATHSESKIY